MHPRWIAVLGGVGVLDLAYINFVLGPHWFDVAAAEAAPSARSTQRTAPAPLASPAPVAVSPVAVSPVAASPVAAPPAAPALAPALPAEEAAHQRPPGQTWWIVNFDEAGASLNPAAEQQLRQIAQRVGENHDVRINIIGHADARGDDGYNQKLGQRRAQAVADALLHAGFRPEQMEIASKGAASPAVLGASQQAWASNRRAEIEIEAIPRSTPPRSESP
jgi:outer membrane protein OmpA-like peptidoglycan-associated protein